MNQVQQFFEYIFQSFKILIIVQPWEAGIRVRNGKKIKKLKKGLYFRIPFFDSIFIQETRIRVVCLPVQTLTTKDNRSITLNASIGYSIKDVEKLYNSVFHPEMTIQNIAMSSIATYINSNKLEDLSPKKISDIALNKIKTLDYGIDFTYCETTNYAVVKTFRIIQDQSWINEGLSMNEKK